MHETIASQSEGAPGERSAPEGTSPGGGPGRARAAARLLGRQDHVGVLVATIVLVLVIGAFDHRFFQFGQLMNILSQSSYIGILACGMAFL
ncbi:MAG: transporter permease, partial [Modestobacter sp.]|nr:transporter permease [Modestobacter sp.]